MTKVSKNTPQPRATTRKLIEDMLQQRRKMLVLLWELSKLDFKQIDDTVRETVDEFLSILVDYIAAGHFGLYQRIADGSERRGPVVTRAKELYPRIERTTEAAVAFSERYEKADEKVRGARLAADLSALGEEVTTRIELEDKLIDAMLGSDLVLANAAN